jgi:predicted DNA-binding protein
MKVFSIRLSIELYERLKVICKETERTKSYVIRKALSEYFNNKKGKDDNRKTD